MVTEVKVGEFISDDLQKLFAREETIVGQFTGYCTKHNKVITTRICLTAADPVLFILQILIKDGKDGNNGEVTTC
jgi:hypothetical protein